MHLNAVDRHVLHTGARIACDHETRRDIRTVVVFAVRGDREQCVQIDTAGMDDLLAAASARSSTFDGTGCSAASRKRREQARFFDAHRLGDP